MISTTDLAQHTLEQIRCQFLLFELEDLLPSLSLSNLTKCFVLGEFIKYISLLFPLYQNYSTVYSCSYRCCASLSGGNDPQLFCSAVPCEYWNVNKYALLVEPC
ncbi:unnamed protein product [Brassica rapa subsp. narinosa]